MCGRNINYIAGILFCFVNTCFGETVYFLVAETTPAHGDSYVLPLTETNDIAHARDLITYGPSAGLPIIVAEIDCNAGCINRDYLSANKTRWSWHVTEFVAFANITAEILDGWPGLVESDCTGWSGNGTIGFWSYTVTAELGIDPNHWLRDFDGDDDVDFVDYTPVGSNWNNECVQPDWCGGTDLDHSGKVDCNDLRIFAESWLSPFASQPVYPVPPACWSWPYQCYGDADNKTESPTKYRVYQSDYSILNASITQCTGHGGGGWPCPYNTYGYNPCVDFNRDYKIYDDDIAIFQANFQKRDTQLQPICPPYVPGCTP